MCYISLPHVRDAHRVERRMKCMPRFAPPCSFIYVTSYCGMKWLLVCWCAIKKLLTHSYPVYTMKLARRAGSTSARRAHDERSSCTRRAGLMSWLSGHLNGVLLQTFTKLLYERSPSARRALVEPARRASSFSQLHRVNGVSLTHSRSACFYLADLNYRFLTESRTDRTDRSDERS